MFHLARYSAPAARRIASVRSLHISLSPRQGMTTFNKMQREHPGWHAAKVDLQQLIEDFRNLQAWSRYKGNATSQTIVECRNAERALYQLDLNNKGKAFTLGEINSVLDQECTYGWRTIIERVFDNKVAALQGLSKQETAALTLCRIHGIGPKHADRFIAKGVTNRQELLSLANKEDESCKVSHAQRLGAYYMQDIEQLIPRSESEQWRPILDAACQKVDKQLAGEILGSYRREAPYSSDIDYVIRHPSINHKTPKEDSRDMMDRLVAELDEYIVGQLGSGPKQFQGIIKLNKKATARRIDINLASFDHLGVKTLASTGDDRLQKLIRGRAKDLGYFLNDVAIGPRIKHLGTAYTFDEVKIIPAPNEEDIFKLLDLPYLLPRQRQFAYYSTLPAYKALMSNY